MLEATSLSKSYGSVTAVHDVTLRLEPGQVLGYLGPNGSGKTTTVKMLTGLLEPTRGQILYNSEDIHKNLRRYRRHLGYVPEEANLYPYLRGEEYLDMVATLRDMPDARRKSRIPSLLELFSLAPHRHVTSATYSKGMRQRILLIAAIMDNPDVLILDEPFSGLDVTSALVFKIFIQSLQQQRQSRLLLLPRPRSRRKSLFAAHHPAKGPGHRARPHDASPRKHRSIHRSKARSSSSSKIATSQKSPATSSTLIARISPMHECTSNLQPEHDGPAALPALRHLLAPRPLSPSKTRLLQSSANSFRLHSCASSSAACFTAAAVPTTATRSRPRRHRSPLRHPRHCSCRC